MCLTDSGDEKMEGEDVGLCVAHTSVTVIRSAIGASTAVPSEHPGPFTLTPAHLLIATSVGVKHSRYT